MTIPDDGHSRRLGRWLRAALSPRTGGERRRAAVLVAGAGAGVVVALLAWSALVRTPGTGGERLLPASAGSIVPRHEATIGRIARPSGLAVGPQGRVYVVDSTPGSGSVSVLERDGTRALTIGGAGVDGEEGGGTAGSLLGVAVDDAGRVYVSDIRARRISVFDSRGRFLRVFAGPVFDEAPATPGALFHRDGRIYVCDLGRHRVLVFDLDGRLVATAGAGPGHEAGEMRYPNGVWVDGDGSIFVSDTNNNRIQEFDASGAFVRVLPYAVNNPRGLAGDDAGRLYVTSTLDHSVVALGSDGSLLYVLERAGGSAIGFPTGLAVDGDRLLVTDRAARAVQIWRIPR